MQRQLRLNKILRLFLTDIARQCTISGERYFLCPCVCRLFHEFFVILLMQCMHTELTHMCMQNQCVCCEFTHAHDVHFNALTEWL